ncbi:AtpZ/AtpI family protein [Paracoccus seriniphilus]|uniref:ATP synthase protein I n=2 Tax=Paracoccus seriniphilus TaxID=184748 RepID=A0A239PNV1_9RHOB|nr:AtpZ/AtpI family protein [Paracoccus seriniphilus]WCR14763.1 AtpZ/AtpI family protein [Paracoccus seriniphilus]SNT71830.1 ATP synthase protein I [Paracoccus seriniphilus]
MAEGPRNGEGRDADAARLRDLEERLSRATPGPEASGPMAGYDKGHLAWRMVTEMVAGILMGCGIGYGLDYLFGTKPFLMILFIFLGFAAGIKTMMRTASELDTKPGNAPETDERD